MGAALSSLSFFCTAVMSALVKATEELTSTAVVLLFQNLICFVLILPFALRGGLASLKTAKFGMHVLRAVSRNRCVVRPLHRHHDDAVDERHLVDLQRSVVDAGDRVGVVPREGNPERHGWAPPSDSSASCWSCSPITQNFNIGALIALAGAFCLSIAFMSVRWLGATEPTSRILFYYFLISSVLCAPFAIVDWRPFGLRGSIYLIGIALTLLVEPGADRSRLPLRVRSQGRTVHLHGDRLHGIDRLVSMEPCTHTARRVRHGAGDRRRNHRRPKEAGVRRSSRRR